MRILVHRPVIFANLAGLLLGFAMFSQFILVSALVQTPSTAGYGFGASVLQTSLDYLLPSSLASLAAARLAGILVRRSGPRRTLSVGAVAGTAGFAALLVAAHEAYDPAYRKQLAALTESLLPSRHLRS
ncbi:hypothetical protein ACFVW9_13930 [Streptomyces sp. NPDC058217]|uniref:hypothetical protein n=1 Tax=Streptomyces sp. NPDC058217 TaxID=3346384 RepID=UPI0036E14A77